MASHLKISNVDHYIQLDILKKLLGAEKPLSFTELKDPLVDNSLFAYHLSKLLGQDLVSKTEDGYRVTSRGARLMNWYGEKTTTTLEPRHLLGIYCTYGGNLLLSKRTGAYSALLNKYMLPGGIAQYGISEHETLKKLQVQFFGEPFVCIFVGLFESIIRHADGFISHHLISLYRAVEVPRVFIPNDRYHLVWVKPSKILSGDPEFSDSTFLADIIEFMKDDKPAKFASKTYQE